MLKYVLEHIFWALSVIKWFYHFSHVYRLGAFNFSKMDTKGPYKVGTRRIRITDKRLEATVFYPIDTVH